MKRTREQVEPNSSPEAYTKIGRIHSPDHSQSTIGQVNKGQCVTAQTAAELPWALALWNKLEDIQNELHALGESQNFIHAEVKRDTEIAEEARSVVMALKTECVSLRRGNTILHDKLLQIESQSRRVNLTANKV